MTPLPPAVTPPPQLAPHPADALAPSRPYLVVLDGVRAVSILAVLVTHLLPVRLFGRAWNDSVGLFGMSLFFVLSGFLITTQLLQRPTPWVFAVRRLCRIVPAAWLCLCVVALNTPIDLHVFIAQALFYANLPPQQLAVPLDHYWSLCVEMQFYLLAALLLGCRPSFTWWGMPVLLIASTASRIAFGVTASSITWFRADDVFAGACLALLYHHPAAWSRVVDWCERHRPGWALLGALVVASVLPPQGVNALSYLRPYLAAAWVATLLAQPDAPMARALHARWMRYVAAISFSLYLWHIPLAATWLGSGDLLHKYLKRPLLVGVLFIVAHVSTYWFEQRFVQWGKRLTAPRALTKASA